MASKRKRDPFWHRQRIRIERANAEEYVVRDYSHGHVVMPTELFRGEKDEAEDFAQQHVQEV